jgi:hypothetical protein
MTKKRLTVRSIFGDNFHICGAHKVLLLHLLGKAETYFNEMLDMDLHFSFDEAPYAKYGLARVALAKGERDKARQIAQEVLNDLSRTVTSHKLLNEIQKISKSSCYY